MKEYQPKYFVKCYVTMTSSNGNIFRVTGLCAGNSSVTGEFPSQRPVTRSFDVFFDLRLNKRLSKQSWGWWFETLSRPLWRQCNVINVVWTDYAFLSNLANQLSFYKRLTYFTWEEINIGCLSAAVLSKHAYICQWTQLSLIQVMAWCIFDAKPFPEPMTNC